MSTQPPDWDTVLNRQEKVESQNRRMKQAAWIIGLE